MVVQTKHSGKSVPKEHETHATYEIGKTKVIVNRVFRDNDGQTLNGILIRLIKKEFEKHN